MRVVLITLLVAGFCPGLLQADNCRVQSFQTHAAAVVAYPTVNYFVGQPVRVQALVRKEMQADPDYKEFLEFKRWKAGQKGEPQQLKNQETPKTKGLLETTCAKCHGGPTPSGAFAFDGTHAISAEAFQKIVSWASGRVKPPGEKMPGVMQQLIEQKKTAQLLAELVDLQARKEEE